jgi:hypothetical protein
MLIGIVADIHEAIAPLQCALAEFTRRDVERVISLGDACDTFGPCGRTAEVVALLRTAEAIGVWGNHDFGLCFDVSERLRVQIQPPILEYMGSMEPHLSIETCRFSHVEPWLDARKVEDLWYFDGAPDTPEKVARSFACVPERHLFVGHFHRWLIMTPSGRLDWNGSTSIELGDESRYLAVIAAVCDGWCATFDTATLRLTPIRCGMPLSDSG